MSCLTANQVCRVPSTLSTTTPRGTGLSSTLRRPRLLWPDQKRTWTITRTSVLGHSMMNKLMLSLTSWSCCVWLGWRAEKCWQEFDSVQKFTLHTTWSCSLIQMQVVTLSAAPPLENILPSCINLWPFCPTHPPCCYEDSSNFPEQNSTRLLKAEQQLSCPQLVLPVRWVANRGKTTSWSSQPLLQHLVQPSNHHLHHCSLHYEDGWRKVHHLELPPSAYLPALWAPGPTRTHAAASHVQISLENPRHY